MKKSAVLSVLILGLLGALVAAPALAGTVLYSNPGPLSYTDDAYGIDGGQAISDSFTLSQNSTVTGANFAAWLNSEDTMTHVDWAISSDPFSGYLATGPGASVSGVYLTSAFQYDVDQESISIPSLSLAAGTYWFELGNAVTAQGGFDAYWDWSGGPSSVGVSSNGTYEGLISPSETFQILGDTGPVVPEPSSFLLLGSGLAGLAGLLKRKLRA